jgi:hypothetical protein
MDELQRSALVADALLLRWRDAKQLDHAAAREHTREHGFYGSSLLVRDP